MSENWELHFSPAEEDCRNDLDHFIRLHESRALNTPDHSAEKWNQRADAWEKDPRSAARPDRNDRVQDTVDFLTQRGLLVPDADIADIGCGPGRFVAAFAETAHSVTGFDISERMIHYGMEHARASNLTNVSFHVCDFQQLDIEKAGYAGKFDLAFCSLTPAIHGMNGLNKMMQLSRAYCCYITHLSSENQLESRIMQELFGRERRIPWSGRWFYSIFNVLFLLGYYPEATYYRRPRERGIFPDEGYVDAFMDHMLQPKERTAQNKARISEWLKAHADSTGAIHEVSETWYGRILWDVRAKTERPMDMMK